MSSSRVSRDGFNSYRVYCDSECLNIEPWSEDIWFLDLVKAGGVLYWWREGWRRKVPNSVLQDTLRTLEDYKKMVARGRLPELPKFIGLIRWDQTVNPLPTRKEAEGY